MDFSILHSASSLREHPTLLPMCANKATLTDHMYHGPRSDRGLYLVTPALDMTPRSYNLRPSLVWIHSSSTWMTAGLFGCLPTWTYLTARQQRTVSYMPHSAMYGAGPNPCWSRETWTRCNQSVLYEIQLPVRKQYEMPYSFAAAPGFDIYG